MKNVLIIIVIVLLGVGIFSSSNKSEDGVAQSVGSSPSKQTLKGVEARAAKKYSVAFKLLSEEAAKGDALAKAELGYMYFNGQGISKNMEKALSLIRQAAEQGQDVAQNEMGYLYGTGKEVRKDTPKAIYWYKKAAEQGHDQAAFNLGVVLYYEAQWETGYAEWFSPEQAIYWFSRVNGPRRKKAQSNIVEIRKAERIRALPEKHWSFAYRRVGGGWGFGVGSSSDQARKSALSKCEATSPIGSKSPCKVLSTFDIRTDACIGASDFLTYGNPVRRTVVAWSSRSEWLNGREVSSKRYVSDWTMQACKSMMSGVPSVCSSSNTKRITRCSESFR